MIHKFGPCNYYDGTIEDKAAIEAMDYQKFTVRIRSLAIKFYIYCENRYSALYCINEMNKISTDAYTVEFE